MVSNIWLDIVHTLKGQWDGIFGDFEAKIAQRVHYYLGSDSIHDIQLRHSLLAFSATEMVVSPADHIEVLKIL